MKIWPRSEVSRANMKFCGQSLSKGHYQPTYQQARKGFILFYNLPINSGQKNARKSQCHGSAMLRIFRCTVQNLTGKKECRSQEKKSNHFNCHCESRTRCFWLTEKEISTIKDSLLTIHFLHLQRTLTAYFF